MPVLLLPWKSFSVLNQILPLKTSVIHNNATQFSAFPIPPKYPLARTPKSSSNLCLHWNPRLILQTHVLFCSKSEIFEDFSTTQLPKGAESEESKELELLGKPYLKQINNGVGTDIEEENKNVSKDEALDPFYKLFKTKESFEQESDTEQKEKKVFSVEEERKKISVEYYKPKPRDLVVGVVVSGNEHKLDVNVGADLLGTMLTKDVLPLYDKEMGYLLCDLERDAEEFLVRGKMGIVRYDEALSGGSVLGRPVVEPGTVLFAEVLGRTLGGRPLLSTRRLFRRIAWHRVRQIKQLNEPIEVKITEWNTGGLVTRIEGLRAFLPMTQLMNRVNNWTELKERVGRRINVLISRIEEETNDLRLSEKDAWEMSHLREGTLVEGTVRRLFPYGAQISIGESNRSGLLHISNVSRGKVTSINNLLAVDEKVKVMVVKSVFPGKISLSIADLESESGLFLSDKQRVFSEAKEMAKKYRRHIKTVSATRKPEPLPTDKLPFEDEESLYANWKWFKFERGNVQINEPTL